MVYNSQYYIAFLYPFTTTVIGYKKSGTGEWKAF